MFLDLGYSREQAQNLFLRSELMSRIERCVRSSGLAQKECSARMGVTQPRLNDLLKAKIDKFSLDHRHNHNIKTDQRNKITD